jgi:hypothetical protein
MVEVAHAHFRFDSPVTRAYHRIAERWGKGKAKVAVARMLLLVCRSVRARNLPYSVLVDIPKQYYSSIFLKYL